MSSLFLSFTTNKHELTLIAIKMLAIFNFCQHSLLIQNLSNINILKSKVEEIGSESHNSLRNLQILLE